MRRSFKYLYFKALSLSHHPIAYMHFQDHPSDYINSRPENPFVNHYFAIVFPFSKHSIKEMRLLADLAIIKPFLYISRKV